MGKARLLSYVRKRTVTIIVIQGVSMHPGDKDVFVSVIIVIADGDPDVKSAPGEPGFFRDVRKRAISVVMEEPIPIFWRSFLQTGYVGTVCEKNVQIAVVIVIKDCNAASHRFRHVLLRCLATIE